MTPAILYHKITNRWEVGVTWLPPVTFRRQIETLLNNGWRAILPGEDANALNSKTFHIIFDDGYECVYEQALPILEELNCRATISIPTGYIGSLNDWDHNLLGRRFRHVDAGMLRDFAGHGWHIGSHGVGHIPLTALSPQALKHEVESSKKRLDDLLGIAVDVIAFPFGRYNSAVVEYAANAGYRIGITPLLNGNYDATGFTLIEARAVYRLDGDVAALRLIEGQSSGKNSRYIARLANLLNNGTALWRYIFKISTAIDK